MSTASSLFALPSYDIVQGNKGIFKENMVLKLRFSMLVLGLVCFMLFFAAIGEETYFGQPSFTPGNNIYVSESGNDTQPGTLEAPVRTLREAFARALLLDGGDVITIWMRGGTYVFDEPMAIIASAPTTYEKIIVRAYGEEMPVLTGSTPLDGWFETELHGVSVWAAYYQGRTLRALYGEDGARQPSRWPKGGMFSVRDVYQEGDSKLDSSFAFYVNPSNMPPVLDGAVMRLLHWWKDEIIGINAYNPSGGLLMLNRPTAMSVEAGDRFFLEYVSGIPLTAGEWVQDTTANMLYYAPKAGETIGGTRLYAGVQEQLISLRGLSNLEFNGLVFEKTGWEIPNNDVYSDFPQAAYDAGSAIFVSNAKNITFTNCYFRHIGSGCIRLDTAVKSVIINNCSFLDIGAQAIYVHGQNMPVGPMVTENIIIDNNHINGYGLNFYNAAAILIIHARGMDIMHNEIHGGTYTAISAGWVWGDSYSVAQSIRIRNNLIYNIGQGVLSDMGAIYLLGNQPGTVVSGNIIHDVTSAEYGGWGIYLDEGSSEITVTENLVYRCSAQGFHQHNGNNNTVENNIFAHNGEGQVCSSGHGSFYLNKNIIVGQGQHLIRDGNGQIQTGKNIYRRDNSLFVDAGNNNFNLVDDPEVASSEFTPWIFFAGRYMALQQQIFSEE